MGSIGASMLGFLHISTFFSCCLVTNTSFSPLWRVSEWKKSKQALFALPSSPWIGAAQEDPPQNLGQMMSSGPSGANLFCLAGNS